jgi:hypothetical protein
MSVDQAFLHSEATMTKIILAVFLFALPTLAQDSGSAAFAAAGCGAPSTEFSVKVNKKHHPIPEPEPGKATVVVISEFGGLCIGPCFTIRAGIDGTWAGAVLGPSYTFFTIPPGDHRVCVAYQSRLKGRFETAAAATVIAQAGNVYYFRVGSFHDSGTLALQLVDSAEGPLLIKSAALSTPTPKKQ